VDVDFPAVTCEILFKVHPACCFWPPILWNSSQIHAFTEFSYIPYIYLELLLLLTCYSFVFYQFVLPCSWTNHFCLRQNRGGLLFLRKAPIRTTRAGAGGKTQTRPDGLDPPRRNIFFSTFECEELSSEHKVHALDTCFCRT
jgi:hypothetical protein